MCKIYSQHTFVYLYIYATYIHNTCMYILINIIVYYIYIYIDIDNIYRVVLDTYFAPFPVPRAPMRLTRLASGAHRVAQGHICCCASHGGIQQTSWGNSTKANHQCITLREIWKTWETNGNSYTYTLSYISVRRSQNSRKNNDVPWITGRSDGGDWKYHECCCRQAKWPRACAHSADGP
jgi:hypothetical protein